MIRGQSYNTLREIRDRGASRLAPPLPRGSLSVVPPPPSRARGIRKKLLIAAAALIVAIAAAEITTRVIVLQKTGATDFDTYRRRALGEAMPIFETDENGELIDIKPNAFQGSLIHINRQGFRGKPVAEPKAKDGFRICFIGGSGCFGTTSSSDATTIEGFLEKKLREQAGAPELVEVMNGGIPGATTARAIGRYEKRLAKYNPDIVLLYNLVNDMLESRRANLGIDPRTRPDVKADTTIKKLLSHSAIWLVYATAKGQREKTREVMEMNNFKEMAAVGSPERAAKVKKIDDAIAPEKSYQYDGALEKNLYLVADHMQQFRAQLDRYYKSVTASGARPVYCTFAFRFDGTETQEQYLKDGPLTARYLPNWPMARDAMKAMNDIIREKAKETNSPLIDIDAELKRQRHYYPDGDTDHFTDAGCAAVADLIAAKLESLQLLSGAALKK